MASGRIEITVRIEVAAAALFCAPRIATGLERIVRGMCVPQIDWGLLVEAAEAAQAVGEELGLRPSAVAHLAKELYLYAVSATPRPTQQQLREAAQRLVTAVTT